MLTVLMQKHPLILVSAIVLAAVIPFHGTRGLYETTEGRYAECARQTLLSGDYDDPVLNGEYHWSKPPLTYLAIMAGLKVLGMNTWGARAYLIPCFWLTMVGVYYLGLWMFDRHTAVLSALVFASSLLPLASSNIVSADLLLTMWVSWSLACFWAWGRRRQKLPLWLACAFLGLGFLTKGPPALFPLFAILPAYYVLRRSDKELHGLFGIVPVLIFVITGLGWYVCEALHHPGLASYWLGYEMIGRNFSDSAHRNPEWYKGFAIYLPVLALGTGAWGIVAADVALKHRREWGSLRCVRWREKPEALFLALGVLLPLACLMVSKSKLALYILPLFPLLCVAIGWGFARALESGTLGRSVVPRIALATVIVFIGGKGLIGVIPSSKDMQALAKQVRVAEEDYPGYELFVKGHPLNGLQFYLERPIPRIDDIESLEKALRDHGALVVVKKSSMPALQELRTSIAFHVIELENKSYCLAAVDPVRVERPAFDSTAPGAGST